MSTNATARVADVRSADLAPLQIVLTYDHPAMADAARNRLNGFLTRWAADVDIHRDEWSFTDLEHPKCRSEALELATHCDLFIAAVSGMDDVPESFVLWLKDWFASRAQMDSALILCIGSSIMSLSNMPFLAAIESLARSNGLSSFTTTGLMPQTILPPSPKLTSLFARLKMLGADSLPENSGINE
jgi:hypothetical protein